MADYAQSPDAYLTCHNQKTFTKPNSTQYHNFKCQRIQTVNNAPKISTLVLKKFSDVYFLMTVFLRDLYFFF